MMTLKSQALYRIGAVCGLLLVSACAHETKPVEPPPPGPVQPAKVQIAPRINHWSGDWTALFDGQSLTNWTVTDFAGHGVVSVASGQIKIGAGSELSGITWTNGTLPKTDYEISLQATKVDGGDFFCGLTFPVADSSCSLIIGGWGGSVIGLSSLDGNDASENETTTTKNLEKGHWYQVRLRVTPAKIQAWLDQEKVVDVSIVGRKVSLRPGPIDLSEPLGVATYETSAGIRDFKLRIIEH
jgi:hypothetical protein